MKALLSWLKDFVDIDIDVNTLCDKLVSIGFEVEDVEYRGKNIENVVTGKILKIEKHPDADKLVVCDIDVGDETLQIVTGANNIKEGDVVPVAKHGARLPDGTVIKKGKLRGVESNGMLCSGEELGVTEDDYPGASVYGILILDAATPLGMDIKPVLGLDDYVLDIGVTSNRPDCQSILGIAREVAVALGKKVKIPEFSYTCDSSDDIGNYVSADVQAPDLCPVYLMGAVKNVKIAPSPLWMRRRLRAVGLRGISNMVDITNYILWELGQPMHAFDYKDIRDKSIIVRRAKDGETIIPLDNKTYTLDNDVLVIADKERAVGLAGIMGGSNSGIKDDTTMVVFEAAKFSRENIRKNSRKLGIRSDSSARFEKGVNSFTTRLALKRAMQLSQQMGCGVCVGGMIDITSETAHADTIAFRFSKIKRLLGISVPKAKVIAILDTLGIHAKAEDGMLICDVPEYRDDLERDCDIIEEIIRVYGYDHIKPTLLENASITHGGRTKEKIYVDKAKNILVGLGCDEIITYGFFGKSSVDKLGVSADDEMYRLIRIKNPLGEEVSCMRSTLIPGMLNTLSLNQSRANRAACLFEFGKVFKPMSIPLEDLPYENERLCVGFYGGGNFFRLKGIITALLGEFGCDLEVKRSDRPYLHPGVSADIVVDGEVVGCFGAVHPNAAEKYQLTEETFIADIDFDRLSAHFNETVKFKAIPKFPAVERDLSVVVDESVPVGELIAAAKQNIPVLEEVSLFDIYQGNQVEKGKKSVSLSFRFRSESKTLTDDEIEKHMKKILGALQHGFDAKLR